MPGGYWVATDLAQYIVQPITGSYLVTASSNPINASQFQEIIDEKSAQFDQAAAKAGFLVPIPTSASQAWRVAKKVVRDGATADLLRIVYTGPDQKYVDRFETSYQVALAAIAAGDMPIPAAPPDPAADGRLFPLSAGIASPIFNATMGIPNDLGFVTDF